MTTDDDDPGPAFTVERSGITGLRDRWYLLRRRGGGLVRVVVPLAAHDPDELAAAIVAALTSVPDRPSRNAF